MIDIRCQRDVCVYNTSCLRVYTCQLVYPIYLGFISTLNGSWTIGSDDWINRIVFSVSHDVLFAEFIFWWQLYFLCKNKCSLSLLLCLFTLYYITYLRIYIQYMYTCSTGFNIYKGPDAQKLQIDYNLYRYVVEWNYTFITINSHSISGPKVELKPVLCTYTLTHISK